ncbi:MAG TPA: cupin domain-containing protein [Candidatus Dormibacteraeota bacterium]|nr:cupin domain-containing protein [Candidatus Dormibacteraeota bacterium]
MNNGYVVNIKKAAKDNEYFRDVVFTAAKSQLVLMSLQPDEEIGMEVHDGDQVIYLVDGEGFAVLDGSKHDIKKGSIVFVPTGVRHNVVNNGDEPMKLFTVYAPPQHAAGTVEPKKDTVHVEDLEEEVVE